ncbi:MAG: SdrD B-like domain-containing protein, partial [Anaerolineae bacterium]
MRTHYRALISLLAALCVAAALAGTLHAAPLAQGDFTIGAVAYVDVAGGGTADCPGCNGEYDPEDEAFATTNPLGTMEFVVKDMTGTEVARGTTEALVGLQRAQLTVPAIDQGESYTLELVAPPDGWQLCTSESASRTIPFDAFIIDNAREDFHFYMGCNRPTDVPTQAGVATNTPQPSAPTATPMPSDNGGGNGGHHDGGDDDKQAAAAPAVVQGGAPTGGGNGEVRGVAFIDANQNGRIEGMEGGIGDVVVRLEGNGLDLVFKTLPTGQFNFTNLPAGTYNVLVVAGGGAQITTPSFYRVIVNGDVIQGIDFGFTSRPRGPAPRAYNP